MRYSEQVLKKKILFKKVTAKEFYNTYQCILNELYKLPKNQDIKNTIINAHLTISNLNFESRLQKDIAESINPKVNLPWGEIQKISPFIFSNINDERYRKMSLSGALMELRSLAHFPYDAQKISIKEEDWTPKIYNINYNRQFCNQKNVDFTFLPKSNNWQKPIIELPYDNKSGDYSNLNQLHHAIFFIEKENLICYNYKNNYSQETYLNLKKIEINKLKEKLYIMNPQDRQKILPLISYIEDVHSKKNLCLENILYMDGEIYETIQNICLKYQIFFKNSMIIPEIHETKPIIQEFCRQRVLSYEDENIIKKINYLPDLNNSRLKKIATIDYCQKYNIKAIDELAVWSLRYNQGISKFNLPFDIIQQDFPS